MLRYNGQVDLQVTLIVLTVVAAIISNGQLQSAPALEVAVTRLVPHAVQIDHQLTQTDVLLVQHIFLQLEEHSEAQQLRQCAMEFEDEVLWAGRENTTDHQVATASSLTHLIEEGILGVGECLGILAHLVQPHLHIQLT